MIEDFLKDTKALETIMSSVLDVSLESLPQDVPIAASIYHVENDEHQLLSCKHNSRESHNDPTNHAEINVIREASQKIGDWRLEDCVLFATLEPCIMCAGAIVQSRMGAVVFGAFDTQYGACGSIYNFLSDPRLNHNPQVVSGILERECTDTLNKFFNELRKK